MEIRQIRTFLTTATLLSFNRAAQQLHCAQSTISAQIQALEEDLGTLLFDRLSQGIALTAAGERFLGYAERVLGTIEEARAAVRGSTPQGSLSIRVPDTIAVCAIPAIVARFQIRFPHISLHFNSCSPNGLRDLDRGLIDLAFVLSDTVHGGDLCYETVAPAPIVLVAHPNHPLTRVPNVTTAMLVEETLLFTGSDCAYNRLLHASLAEQGLEPRHLMEMSNVAGIKTCLKNQWGISVLPLMAVAEDLAGGALVSLPWSGTALDISTLMVWHASKWQSAPMREFMAIAREEIRRLSKSPCCLLSIGA